MTQAMTQPLDDFSQDVSDSEEEDPDDAPVSSSIMLILAYFFFFFFSGNNSRNPNFECFSSLPEQTSKLEILDAAGRVTGEYILLYVGENNVGRRDPMDIVITGRTVRRKRKVKRFHLVNFDLM